MTSDPGSSAPTPAASVRTLAWLLAPSLLVLVWVVLPLVRGDQTLYLRDVFHTHVPLKAAAAAAYAEGAIPLLDPYRGGGQPLLGNPNAVTLYPTDVLYRVAPFFWAFNAHFWLHCLLAPLAMAALARALGGSPVASAGAGAAYAASGYFVSQLSFYNLIGAATLAPAFAAAAATAAAPSSARTGRLALVACGLLWGLLVLAGDPISAVLALALAVACWWLRRRGRRAQGAAGVAAPGVGLAFIALAAGTAVAAPQWIEFLRILPLSHRGYWGFSPQVATLASLDPRQLVEWVLPFAFGRPDLLEEGRFWGFRFYSEGLPYYPTLYPGLLCLVAVAAVGRPRSGGERLAWLLVGGALFLVLGGFNPLVAPLFALSGLLRYPIKCWLLGAVGAALLCGRGIELLVAGDRPARRRAALAAAALAMLLIGAGAFALAGDLSAPLFSEWMGHPAVAGEPAVPPPPAMVASERGRQLATAAISLALGLALAAGGWLVRRRPAMAGVWLALHVASQLYLLAPARVTDAVAAFRERPALAAAIPAGALVVHGDVDDLFAVEAVAGDRLPTPHVSWLQRAAHEQLQPPSGVRWGLHYDLNYSTEGLDSFLGQATGGVVRQVDDLRRLRLLRAWGVTHLLLGRPLDPSAGGLVDGIAVATSFGRAERLFRLRGSAPPVALLSDVLPAGDLKAAVQILASASFDPLRQVVVPTAASGWHGEAGAGGGGLAAAPEPGTARLLASGPESLRVETASPLPGILLVQRAHLDGWRATIDGVPAPITIGNLARLAVAVPAGRHQVRLWYDRRPFVVGVAAAALGLVVLVGLGVRGARFGRGGG